MPTEQNFDILQNTMVQVETAPTTEFDAEAAWKKIENQLSESTTQRARTLPLRQVFSIAASLLLLIGIGIFAYQQFVNAATAQFANNSTIENTVTFARRFERNACPKSIIDV